MNNYDFSTSALNNNSSSQAPANQSRRSGNANYAERPFSDLVDEDKRPFVRRRILATFLGGYRLMYDEGENISLPFYFHIFQVLIYLFIPAFVIIPAYLFDNNNTATIASLIVPFVVNLIFQLISFIHFKAKSSSKLDSSGAVDLSEPSFCGWKTYEFIFPHRSSIFELIICLLLTPIYSALNTYMIHESTLTSVGLEGQMVLYQVLTLIVVLLSSYCLLSHPFAESTPYNTNDSFSIFSHHYSRVFYTICFGVSIILLDKYTVDLDFQILYILNFVVLFLQIFGILSNPIVTLMWALEQIDIHIFGSTARASDIRILLSFIFNFGSVCAVYAAIENFNTEDRYLALLIAGALAFISSHNIWFNLGLLKPFKVVNEKYLQQIDYANIVFSETNIKSSKQQSSSIGWKIFKFFIQSILMLGLVLIVIYLGGFLVEDSVDGSGYDALVAIICAPLAGVLAIITMSISMCYRRSLFRVIGCCQKQGGTGAVAVAQVFKNLIILVLCLGISGSTGSDEFYTEQYSYLNKILVYRAYNRCFHAPLTASLEYIIFIAFLFGRLDAEYSMLALLIISVGLQRIKVLINKIDYVMVSIITAYSNKKQRFKSQTICFILQITALLPLFLIVIIITTILDSATIPYLGFAYFIIGYPKPQRQWSQVTPLQANPNDQSSDGHLYQAMLPQLSKQIQQMMNSDLLQFVSGSFYLIKNEKMIALIQVLEKGNNYMIYSIKGTELQETTVCHAEENENINELGDKVFKNKNYCGNYSSSLSAYREINFSIYDDQKVSLTGIIDNPNFAEMIRKAYMRIVTMQINDMLKKNPSLKYYKILKSDIIAKEIENAQKVYDQNWVNYLQIKVNDFKIFSNQIPKSQTAHIALTVQNNKNPNQANKIQAVSQKSFLQLMEEKQPNNQVQASAVQGIRNVNAPAIQMNNNNSAIGAPQRPKQKQNQGPPEEQKIETLAQELDDLISPQKDQNKFPPLKNKSKEQSLNLDDLDDLMGEFKGPKGAKKQSPKRAINTNQTTKQGNPFLSPLHKNEEGRDIVDEELDDLQLEGGEHEFDNKSGISDFQLFVFESYQMIFKDQYGNLPGTLHRLFRGEFYRDLDSADFVDSRDKNILLVKYMLLSSIRLAFHYSVEQFVMGDFNLASNPDFEKEIRDYQNDWFLAGEEHLWNKGIDMNLPNLERIISKKGQYFAHRLRYVHSDEQKFRVFQFRREVVRGIWGNINMELLYYTNHNDERFSIQAERNILRNLLVQMAEVPLGYPVYASGAEIITY